MVVKRCSRCDIEHNPEQQEIHPMKRLTGVLVFLATVGCIWSDGADAAEKTRRTEVAIRGEMFLINGRPTYEGREYNGMKIEGLLMNSRMVQGIFDDLNPDTTARWNYPDTGRWDAHGTRASSSRRCPRGGTTGCWPLRSICKAAARRATRATSPGTTRP
jgi:hypothetical protein